MDSKIYWRKYTTVSRAIKKINTRRSKVILQDLIPGIAKKYLGLELAP